MCTTLVDGGRGWPGVNATPMQLDARSHDSHKNAENWSKIEIADSSRWRDITCFLTIKATRARALS
eukprot:scaffold633_cov134-Isochrysis_galbana.AAC.12